MSNRFAFSSLNIIILVGISALAFTMSACGGDDDDDAAAQSDDDTAPDDDTAEEERFVEFDNGHIHLSVDRAERTFDVALDGFTYLIDATSAIETGKGDLLFPGLRLFSVNQETRGWTGVSSEETAEGLAVTLRFPPMTEGRITTRFILPPDGGLLAGMSFESSGVDGLVSLIPICVDPRTHGGLFMKSDPSAVQVMQNGSETSFDFYADLQYADYPYKRGMLNQYLSNQPSSSSNGNALLYDRANGESVHFGWLSFESSFPEVVIGYDAGRTARRDGRDGWFIFQSRNGFIIPRRENAGAIRESEWFWMDRFAGRPHAALEAYARLLADRLGIVVKDEHRAGWDSWYVYGDQIDQGIIEDNLRGIAENFVDYGMDSLEVDLGWMKEWGDWTDNLESFPDGLAHMADEIRAAGLSPELWMAPFDSSTSSDVLREHPSWRGSFDPLFLLLMQPGVVPLDLTLPDVLDHVAQAGVWARQTGFDSVKFDFAYYETMLTRLQNPDRTVIEAYRDGLRAYREAFGPDRFLINILLNGPSYGLVDSMRISIDSWPCWGDTKNEGCPFQGDTDGYGGFGIRILLKAMARRYYLNNTVWINHPDQIFFRDFLGFIPQRSWATVVALAGGIMSLGDEIATMSEEEIDAYRRLLPNLGVTGVPWDLFDREYPEVWLTSLADRDPPGHLLHLYSWGDNKDRTVNPPALIPEGTRHHSVALADLGLTGPFRAFEFWTQTDLGVVTDRVEIDVPARDCRVIVLRPVEARPYLVASDRHVSQGGTDLHYPLWDNGASTLSWEQDLVLGFPHTVYVDPAGRLGTPTASADNGASASVRLFGELWAVDIDAAATGPVKITLAFGNAD